MDCLSSFRTRSSCCSLVTFSGSPNALMLDARSSLSATRNPPIGVAIVVALWSSAVLGPPDVIASVFAVLSTRATVPCSGVPAADAEANGLSAILGPPNNVVLRGVFSLSSTGNGGTAGLSAMFVASANLSAVHSLSISSCWVCSNLSSVSTCCFSC